MAETAKLGWVDYLIIVIMLGISVGIGIYYRLTGGKQKTISEYFAANRSMSVIPVGIALMVSFMSAITLLGVSAENYIYGTQFVVINISYLLGTPLVNHGFLPVFFKLQATSSFEYLEKRFGAGARTVASIISWLQLLLYSGVVLYAPAIALEATTGLSKTLSIVIIGLVCAFYSSIGGIKAVLMTDVFQGGLMFVSLFAIIGTAAHAVGGLDSIWRYAEEGGRIQFDSISIDPTIRHTWWSLIIGGFFTFLSLFGVNQVQVQRMLTVRSLNSAQKALWLNWPILSLLSVTTCFCGLAIFSKYHDCDPIAQGRIKSMDMLMPLYVMDTMSHIPGLAGLFIAGIFSAGLSTISAALNALAAVTLEDYFKPLYKRFTNREFDSENATILGKALAFVFGLLCIALAFVAQLLGGVLQASLTIFGVVGGPLLAIFTLGMTSETATEMGAITGVISSLCFCMWIAFGRPRPTPPVLPVTTAGCGNQTFLVNAVSQILFNVTEPEIQEVNDSSYFYLYRISYMWYCPIGFFLAYFVGLIVSYLSRCILGNKMTDLDPNLFFPIFGKRIERRQERAAEERQNGFTDNALSTKYSFNSGKTDYSENCSSAL
ncbi:putative sodium-dependent multivitamin transporter [Prorops nasuta]|uniref:putative sodium-dependent multivitamin transporter n=1 Tax=Prorops nasuta TaxID=863751 RepID=UPI0034CD1405